MRSDIFILEVNSISSFSPTKKSFVNRIIFLSKERRRGKGKEGGERVEEKRNTLHSSESCSRAIGPEFDMGVSK